jgi:hypothetical protein
MAASTPPGRKPGQSLPYHDLSSDDFEVLCSDLLASQDDVLSADLNGLPRKHEHGVDVLGQRTDGKQTGIQAKRYKRIAQGKFIEWTNEFLASAAYWRERDLDRFIVTFPLDTRDANRKDELAKCKKLCEAAGFEFETWHLRHLDRLLRRQPQIVHAYFGADWEVAFCGVMEPPRMGTATALRIVSYKRHLTEDVAQAVSAFEQGNMALLEGLLDRLTQAPEEDLSEADRAALLRIRFQVALSSGDRVAAKDLLAGSELQEKPDLTVLYEGSDPTGYSASDLLERIPKASSLVRGQLLLALGRAEEAADVLSEGSRPLDLAVRARAEALRGDRPLALKLAKDALDDSDGSVFVIGSSLAARFACCTAWGFDHDPGPYVPNPLPLGMMRRDADAMEILGGMLRDIRRMPFPMDARSYHFDRAGWEMAILMSLLGRSSEASEVLDADLDRPAPSAAAIHWAMEGGLDLDADRIISSLGRCLRGTGARPDHLFVALSLLEAENRLNDARLWFRRYGSQFRQYPGYADAAAWWKERLSKGKQPDTLSLAIQRAINDRDWTSVTAAAKINADEERILDLLRVAHALAAFDCWNELAPYLGRIEAIGTPEAARIVASAHAKLGRPEEVLRVLDLPILAPGIPEPKNIVHLRADALEAIGRPDEAIGLRQALGEREPSDDMRLAGSLLRTAKFGEAAEVFGRLDPETLPTSARIEVASAMRAFRPDLSRRFMGSIRSVEDVPEAYFGTAYELVARLGLETQADLMIERMASGQFSSVVTIASVDEALGLMRNRRDAVEEMRRQHLDGKMPLAVFAHGSGSTVAGEIWGLERKPILMRHASRLSRHSLLVGEEVEPIGLRGYPDTLTPTLILDYPALLLAARFDILDALLARSKRILIPHAALSAMGEDLTRLVPDGLPLPAHERNLLEALRSEVPAHATTVLLRIADDDPGDGSEITVTALLANENTPGAFRIPPGIPLLLSDGAVFVLLRTGRLEIVLDSHPVWTTQGFGERCRSMFEQHEALRTCCNELRGLAKRIDVERQSGRIDILPQSGGHNVADAPTSAILALQQIITGADAHQAIVVSGDRYTNGFGRIGKTPLIDVETMVSLLEDERALTPVDARRIRFEMRKAECQFLSDPTPDAKDAAMSHAFGAARAAGTVRFDAIRRNVARGLQLGAHLRGDLDRGADGQGFEALPYRDAVVCALDVIRTAWTEEKFDLHRRWEVSSMAFDGLLHLRVPGNRAEADDNHSRHWMAQTYGMLLSTVFIVALFEETRAEEFLTWFQARCGYDLLEDPTLGDMATSACQGGLQALINSLPEVSANELEGADRLAAIRAAQACLALPTRLLEHFSPDLLERIGLHEPDAYEVGAHRITLEALAEAYRSSEAGREVRTLDGPCLPVLVTDDGALAVETDGTRYTCSDPEFDLLAVSLDSSPKETLNRVAWLGTEAEAQIVLTGLLGELSPKSLARSAQGVYGYGVEHLSRTARSQHSFNKTLLHPPPPDIVFRALSVDARDPIAGLTAFPDDCTEADHIMLLRRRLHVPKRLSVDALRGAGMTDMTLRAAAQTASGPVAQAMASLLLEDLSREMPPEPPAAEAFELSTAFVRWSLRRFDRDPRWRKVGSSARLVAAWFHAGELCSVLGQNFEDAADTLRSIALVDGWDPRSIGSEMDDRPLDCDLCGTDVRGRDIALALALKHPDPDALPRHLAELEPTDMIWFFEMHLPDALGSILLDGRKAAARRGEGDPYRVLNPEHLRPEIAQIDLSKSRASHTWNMVLHTMRRGADPEVRSSMIDAWGGIDFPVRCFRDSSWIIVGVCLANSFRDFLSVDDLQRLLAGCTEVERNGTDPSHLRLCEELRAVVAIIAARFDDEGWHAVTDVLVEGLDPIAQPRWRNTLANDLFAANLPRPERAMCLLRKLRAA